MPIDTEDRILEKIDKLCDKIDDLCTWKTRMETNWNNHMKDLESKAINKEKRFYIIIALMGVGFTIQELIRSFL